MSYYILKKVVPDTKIQLGTIFCEELPFRIAVSEKFGWQTVRGISKENVLKYKQYLKTIQ